MALSYLLFYVWIKFYNQNEYHVLRIKWERLYVSVLWNDFNFLLVSSIILFKRYSHMVCSFQNEIAQLWSLADQHLQEVDSELVCKLWFVCKSFVGCICPPVEHMGLVKPGTSHLFFILSNQCGITTGINPSGIL